MTDDTPITDRVLGDEQLPDDEPTLTERLREERSRPRRDRLHDRLAPGDATEWHPAEDARLHRFITLREAGFRRGVDICRDSETWTQVSRAADIGVFGRLVWWSGEFGDPDVVDATSISLNRRSDWELLKEMAGWDPETDGVLLEDAELVLERLEVLDGD